MASPLETDSLARAGLSGRPPRLPASSSIDPVLCLHDRRPAGYYDYRRTPMFRRIAAALLTTESEVLIWLRSVVRRPLNSCSGVALTFPFDEDALRFSAAVVMACACFSSKCLLIRSCVTTGQHIENSHCGLGDMAANALLCCVEHTVELCILQHVMVWTSH